MICIDSVPRTKYRRITLWRAFEPLIAEHPDLIQQLRAVIPDELAAERQEQRQAQRNRVTEGRYSRATTKSSDMADLKRRVRRMISQGHTQEYVAKKLGITQGRVSQIKKNLNQKKANKASNSKG